MHLPGRQRLYSAGAVLALLGGLGYVGLQWLKPVAPLSVEPLAAPPKIEAPRPSEEAKPAPKEVVVALAGAVRKPGLLRLPSGARVDDAIRAGGGAAADADLEAINLAAKAVDGDQIYVPRKAKPEEPAKVAEAYRGGTVAPSYAPLPLQPPPLSGSLPRGSKAKAPAGPVSLNTGSEAQLETLPGVGPATAGKILEYRQAHGGFASVEEIQAVKGIGPKKFEKMKPFLKL